MNSVFYRISKHYTYFQWTEDGARFSNPILDTEVTRHTSGQSSRYHTGTSIKSQVLDLETLPIFSPLEISVKYRKQPYVKLEITNNMNNRY